MARSGNYQITGYELQAMVNENLIGQKGSIPQTNRCLTRQEVFNAVYCYAGDSPTNGPFIPYSSWQIGGTLYSGPSPNYTCNYNYIAAIPSTSLLFEMSQEGNPYLNVDLFGYVNGSPLRLDPNNGLDGMFFGSPQYSPQMSSAVKVGMTITVQGNYGLNSPEGPSYGWDAPGYGFLEVYANGSLVSNQSVYKSAASSANQQYLYYTFTVQAGVSYYAKAYSLVTYTYDECVGSNAYGACNDCGGAS
jgi:hypothetical protein